MQVSKRGSSTFHYKSDGHTSKSTCAASERWHLTFLTSQVEQAPPRHSHSAVLHDGAMWVYGGLTDLQERADFWRWDFVSRLWIRLRAQRGGPGELHGHTAVKAGSYMYLFGGERAGQLLDELWRYHFVTETWERLQIEGVSAPSPRCRHVAVAGACEAPLVAWGGEDRAPLKEISEPYKSQHPPKSISMCFGQQHDASRRPFKFRVHPVSRLCSKNTTSDEDDDDQEYVASYNSQIAQVNISRSLKEKISTSRLVRSISGGNYNILQGGGQAGRCEELERLVEETPQHLRKSHSSDAVLTESEASTPQHQARWDDEEAPMLGRHARSGYHSFTEEDLGIDYHKEFAGGLATAVGSGKNGPDLELKTFHGARARSWDRTAQRRVHQENRAPPDSPRPRWTTPRIEHRDWQLCFYVVGGREQSGAPGVYRQPLPVWKLYM
ncbi:hypothetical protein LAZ67_1000783 [Cordylochernes scorpioides]|uniref:Uncharacterized protein n=1 Tax=Cordylochernes scorpioides TaxID=51811 RepID=A0ABY6JV82_9ARAC|nr:hypothetical protein LAZ67_1000783 [Cordylochernes scorpioides]